MVLARIAVPVIVFAESGIVVVFVVLVAASAAVVAAVAADKHR